MIYIVLENQKASKNSFEATTFKVEENSRTFKGKMEFKDFSRTSPKIQGPWPIQQHTKQVSHVLQNR